jgi:hypothetical protein
MYTNYIRFYIFWSSGRFMAAHPGRLFSKLYSSDSLMISVSLYSGHQHRHLLSLGHQGHPERSRPARKGRARPPITALFTESSSWAANRTARVTLHRNLDLCLPRKGIARPRSQFPHLGVCERSKYFHDRSTYFPAAE